MPVLRSWVEFWGRLRTAKIHTDPYYLPDRLWRLIGRSLSGQSQAEELHPLSLSASCSVDQPVDYGGFP